jgi:hypothetical protein
MLAEEEEECTQNSGMEAECTRKSGMEAECTQKLGMGEECTQKLGMGAGCTEEGCGEGNQFPKQQRSPRGQEVRVRASFCFSQTIALDLCLVDWQ